MYSATFYFLGLAGFLIGAMACLTRGKHASRRVDLDLEDLRAASIGMVMVGNRPSWSEIRALWMKWYANCQEKAIVKQQSISSWTRTLALCAVLCLFGVLLEVKFDKPITFQEIWFYWFPS